MEENVALLTEPVRSCILILCNVILEEKVAVLTERSPEANFTAPQSNAPTVLFQMEPGRKQVATGGVMNFEDIEDARLYPAVVNIGHADLDERVNRSQIVYHLHACVLVASSLKLRRTLDVYEAKLSC